MSAAAADAAPAKKGLPKKLLIIIIAVVVLLAGGGGAAVFMMKKKAAEAAAAEADEDGESEDTHAKDAHKSPPVFVPLDPFTVNLADREAERFAQIGITLELREAKYENELKLYMPAVRNALLMTLAHKTSAELLERSGKTKLAGEIGRETARAMGYEIEEPDEDEAADDADAHADEDEDTPKKKKKKKKKKATGPVSNVLFSSFIIQ